MNNVRFIFPDDLSYLNTPGKMQKLHSELKEGLLQGKIPKEQIQEALRIKEMLEIELGNNSAT